MAVAPWVVAVTTAAVDLVSKAWVRAYVPPLSPDGPPLRVELVLNRGASLGLGAGHPHWVVAISAAALLALAVWLTRAGSRLERVGIALALGGGLGNLADRLAHGAVTDWIHVQGYTPTFNLADVAIRAGLAVALAGVLLGHRRAGGSATPASRARS